MTLAEELLENLETSYLVNPELEPHIVIDTERNIHVPKELERIAVERDHNVETVTFDCPRYWDGHDLSEMYIYVNYLRADRVKGSYLCKNVTVDSADTNILHFTWTLEEHATMVKGKLNFLVCAKKTGDDGVLKNHWNSELCDKLKVSEGLECEDAVYEMNVEIITDLLTRMDHILLANDPLVLDTSLTEAGLAAEAKATGERFNEVDTTLNQVNSDIITLTEYNNRYQSYITPPMVGAPEDGSTDVTAYLQDLAETTSIVDLKGHSYVVTNTITLDTMFRNGVIIYKGPADIPVIQLRDGAGLNNIKIIIQTANYSSSIILADYTIYDEQYMPMRFTIDGLHIDNTISTSFVEGSSCLKITYDKYKVIYGQNINGIVFDGHIDYGIYIEPILRDENDNPVFNTATLSNMFFFSANCALKVLPVMATGSLENALGGVVLQLNNFANQHIDGIEKAFMDLHNTTIFGKLVVPWDYYGDNIPAVGTYLCQNSNVHLDYSSFYSKNDPDSVRFTWTRTSTNETYSYLNHIITDEREDESPTRSNGMNWSRNNVKMIAFAPQTDNPYGLTYIGFEFQRNNASDPTGKQTVQFGVSPTGLFVNRMYDPDTNGWTECRTIYSEGKMPQSYVGKRPNGFGVGDMKFDTTIKKPVWWDGSKWITADGTAI